MRGEGGILKTIEGVDFMDKYHPQQSLAPRDIVARAIDTEMKKSGATNTCCLTSPISRPLSSRTVSPIFTNLPAVTASTSPGADTRRAGGALPMRRRGDQRGRPDRHAGLYAVGEVACTGLHGANRLASNSLLEALVCAHRAAERVRAYPDPSNESPFPPGNPVTPITRMNWS